MAKLSLEYRLKCPRSYATEETPDLLCSAGNGEMKCDGSVYDCCMWDIDYGTVLEVMSDENSME